MNDKPLFYGARLKIERANQHIQELHTRLLAFLKTDFCRIYVEHDPQDDGDVLMFEVTEDLPWEIALVVGDAVHNLRTALDLMTWELVEKAGGTLTREVKFPFMPGRNELIAALKGGEIKSAGNAVIDLISDTIKPYPGGNDPLYSLHDLDIRDKHKLLIPTMSRSMITGIYAENDREGGIDNLTVSFSKARKVRVHSDVGKLKITDYGQRAFQVFFDEGQPFEGKPLVPTLHQLSQLVAGVVDAIEDAFVPPG